MNPEPITQANDTLERVREAVAAADDRKAVELQVLHLGKVTDFTEYFLICGGTNERQVQAIADAVEQALRARGIRPSHVEGYDRAEWILMDFFTFIVHVFTPQTRAFYSLERLWGDAERIDVASDVNP